LTWPAALLFGALIAATDPISVVGIFRRLGAPKRLAVLLEGESLFNDGTAVVLFNLAAAVAVTGTADWGGGLLLFVWTAGGGLLIGLGLGWLISRVIATIDDHLVETTLTTVLAFGSYLVAEQVGMSGVLAVVAAGLVNGNLGPQGMRPGTRLVVFTFWEYAAFLASSAVFLLIGLQVNLATLAEYAIPVVWAVAAVLSAAITIYGVARLGGRCPGPAPCPLRGVARRCCAGACPELSDLRPERGGPRMTFGVVLSPCCRVCRCPLRRLGTGQRRPMEPERRHACHPARCWMRGSGLNPGGGGVVCRTPPSSRRNWPQLGRRVAPSSQPGTLAAKRMIPTTLKRLCRDRLALTAIPDDLSKSR
jgi:hypothetical protein